MRVVIGQIDQVSVLECLCNSSRAEDTWPVVVFAVIGAVVDFDWVPRLTADLFPWFMPTPGLVEYAGVSIISLAARALLSHRIQGAVHPRLRSADDFRRIHPKG